MSLPLENIRVLDLTRLLPGPYCTLMLADFGADVIKIEEPGNGDYARWEKPMIDDEGGAIFYSLNRNKRSVSLDLKSENGKEIFFDLVKTADVLVESFRPGVMERLGLGYEKLQEINKGLIYCAITGFGQTGPYSKLPGHDLNYLSYAGLLDLQGEKNGKPLISSIQIADIAGGAQMAINGILLALLEKNKSGEGQFVDISMLDGSVSLMQTLLPEYLASGELPKRGESVLNGGRACYEVYKTKDQRFLSVAALEPKFWVEFCKVIGEESLISLLNGSQLEQESMKRIIQEIIIEKTLEEWVVIFKDVDTCVAPVLNLSEMISDPQIIEREIITDVNFPNRETLKQVGIPIKLSKTPGGIRSAPPKLGEHNEEIFLELGYSDTNRKSLRIGN
ncbi:CaiB/BaiF CoA-transferase family protein [Psychrobacillus sp. OK032]|uniref:CaiB/BaiF CoA transferase family protein n=1 Tax=Psychrobacillus sp. OK032 TaxID=1884358 RepID=UPI0008CCD6A8|nr:CaiB/BaiF CoA-transferase family protein [Psychrobacillus sp. OK032]SER86704.1 Crotonobetainyl-CoA:carnitine CoA-transferase CaiB [Psychrobacillus sp. OK032]